MSSSDAARDRNWRRFALRVALFVLPLAILAFAADKFVSGNLRRSLDGELGAWNPVYAGRINSDLVIYGTSRAVGQFDPQILGERLHIQAYNLGMQGNNFPIQYLRHQALLRHNAAPKVILQSVEPFTFLGRRDGLYDPEQFLPYMLEDPLAAEAAQRHPGFNYWDRHAPMVRYYGHPGQVAAALRLAVRGADAQAERARGYKTRAIEWNGDGSRARRYWQAQRPAPDPEAFAVFERFLQECRARGIRVVLVSPPEYVGTRAWVPHREEIAARVAALARAYAVPHLDYSANWMTDKPSLFSDPMHLNTKGVALFTAELARDLQPILALPPTGARPPR